MPVNEVQENLRRESDIRLAVENDPTCREM